MGQLQFSQDMLVNSSSMPKWNLHLRRLDERGVAGLVLIAIAALFVVQLFVNAGERRMADRIERLAHTPMDVAAKTTYAELFATAEAATGFKIVADWPALAAKAMEPTDVALHDDFVLTTLDTLLNEIAKDKGHEICWRVLDDQRIELIPTPWINPRKVKLVAFPGAGLLPGFPGCFGPGPGPDDLIRNGPMRWEHIAANESGILRCGPDLYVAVSDRNEPACRLIVEDFALHSGGSWVDMRWTEK